MSITQDFQKVIDSYRALGRDDFEVGDSMVAEFLEDFTGLEDFLDQGERESDEHFAARVSKSLKQLAPLVAQIPERELAGAFSWRFMDGSFLIDDFSQPDVLLKAIADFVLNSDTSRLGVWFAEDWARDQVVDFLMDFNPDYAETLADYVKERLAETNDAGEKAALKTFRADLITATPGQSKAAATSAVSAGVSALASAGTETVAQAFSNDSKLIKHFSKFVSAALEYKFITNLWGSTDPAKGADPIIFTDQFLILVGAGYGGWLDGGYSADTFIHVQNIDHLSLGTAHHVQYSGFTSSEGNYWTLAVITHDGAVYERYIALGNGEKQINESRQRLTHTFQYLANFFTVTVDGGHAESSDGYTTTMSYGVWNSF